MKKREMGKVKRFYHEKSSDPVNDKLGVLQVILFYVFIFSADNNTPHHFTQYRDRV